MQRFTWEIQAAVEIRGGGRGSYVVSNSKHRAVGRLLDTPQIGDNGRTSATASEVITAAFRTTASCGNKTACCRAHLYSVAHPSSDSAATP